MNRLWALLAISTGLPLAAQTAALEEVGVLRLEETERHLVVRPNLVPDPLGGWIYWDSELNEARLFDADGRLTVAFGRPGEGPGEFERLVGVVRVDDGRLVTLDGRGRVGIWSPSGDSLIDDFRSDVIGARSLVAIGPGRVLASIPGVIRGRIGWSVPLLHSIDVDRRESDVSAYLPPSDPAWAPVLAAVTAPGPVRRGALLHVAAAPHDSIWTLSLPSLTRRSAIGVGVQRLRLDPPPAEAIQGRRAWFEWVTEAWFVGRFAPLRDGDWLVQTWAVRPSGGRDRTLHRLDPSRTVRREIDDDRVPLAVDPDSDHLLLWSELHPAEIAVAVIR